MTTFKEFFSNSNTELSKALVSFLLTSVLGAFIGSWLEYIVQKSERGAEQRELHKKEAMVVFNEVSALAETRWYATLRLNRNLKNSQVDDLTLLERVNQYRLSVNEWNMKYTRLLTLIGWYYGSKTESEFEKKIGERLIYIGNIILPEAIKQMKAQERSPVKDFEKDISKIRISLRVMQKEMVKKGICSMKCVIF